MTIGTALVLAGVAGLGAVAWRRLQVASAETARLQAQLETLLRLVPGEVRFIDPDGGVVLSNVSETGAHGNDFAAARFPRLREVDGLVVPPDRQPVERALRGEAFSGWMLRIEASDGHDERLVACDGAPVIDGRGRQIQAVVVVRDLTERLLAESFLRRSQKMQAIGVLTAGITHDFNNLLTVILGSASMARLAAGEGPIRRDLDRILSAARRGAAMTGRLTALVRRGHDEPGLVHPGRLLRGLEPILRRLAPSSIALDVADHTGESGTVHARAQSVEQVIVGLFSMAQEPLDSGGRLSLRCDASCLDADGDTPTAGVAISVEGVRRWRVAETRPGEQAAGDDLDVHLGLAMVRALMERDGGHVRARTAGDGATTITALWPEWAGAAEPAAMAAEPHPDVRGGTETILVAENDDDARGVLQQLLEVHGYTVVATRTGCEAVDRFRGHAGVIGLLVLDLTMPRMGGREVVAALGSDVPVIFTTGHPAALDAASSAPDGAVLVTKPWVPAELLGTIRRLLDARPTH